MSNSVPIGEGLSTQARILVIRGGALGDFVLTLPAIGLLREAFPTAALELLAYPHIASLAEGRFYAERVRSIEYGPMAGFFARNGTLDVCLGEYFASFAQVVSYLYDPDGIFEENLRKVGVRHFLSAYGRPKNRHASREWAAPLEKLALYLEDPAAKLYLLEEDKQHACEWLGVERRVRLAIHPGSGSPRKNWPPECWGELGRLFWETFPEGELVLIGGEADMEVIAVLHEEWRERRCRVAAGLPLPLLAALIAEIGCFAGHDSGVSHVAAAAGAQCVLLFGPTDPGIWAPLNSGVRVVCAPQGDLFDLKVLQVWQELLKALVSCP